MSKKRLILLIIILIGIWYFWGGEWYANRSSELSEQAAIMSEQQVPDTADGETVDVEDPAPAVETGKTPTAAGQARVHYLTKNVLEACGTSTVSLVQDIDVAHGHPSAGALVAMTLALPEGAPDNYTSALLSGTRLLSLKIDGEGTTTADYNSRLKEDLGECGAVQRRTQIENTLGEFAEVKKAVITINGEVW